MAEQRFHLDLDDLPPLTGTGPTRLHGFVHGPTDAGRRPTVVLCHGFKGFGAWGFFPPLARLLADRGFTVVRFNFTGSGQGPDDERVTDLAAFRRNTFSRERDELLGLLGGLERVAPGLVDGRRIALFGHSRGGGAALLAAAAAPWRERLRALVTWSAVASFDRYRRRVDAWRRDGALAIENARTGQRLELGVELLDDLEQRAEELDLEAAAARRRVPWLIVHGSDDETVDVDEARRLHAAAAADDEGPTELHLVAGGGHTFGARHPFVGPTRELTQAMNATQVWLRRHCPAR